VSGSVIWTVEPEERYAKLDDLVKSLKRRISVIPANPGSGPGQAPESSYFKYLKILWTPVSTGVTTLYENIKLWEPRILFFHKNLWKRCG
jgi:hypothetical protein